MIRNLHFIFCENEHGTGDVCFPDVAFLSGFEIKQEIIQGNTIRSLRKAAKQKGWGRVNGGDYCPGCMENGI